MARFVTDMLTVALVYKHGDRWSWVSAFASQNKKTLWVDEEHLNAPQSSTCHSRTPWSTNHSHVLKVPANQPRQERPHLHLHLENWNEDDYCSDANLAADAEVQKKGKCIETSSSSSCGWNVEDPGHFLTTPGQLMVQYVMPPLPAQPRPLLPGHAQLPRMAPLFISLLYVILIM